MIEQHESQYQSYLLRLWRAGEGKSWRVMLEHVRTCERYGFSDLEGLCTFLREQMDEQEEERGIGEIRFTGGNAPTKTGGTSPKKAGGTSPKKTGGTSPKKTGGTSPKKTGGTSPKILD